MTYDNTCKYLAETYPSSFVRWLLNKQSENIEVLKTELSAEPIMVDALVLLQIDQSILHLEFQTLPYSDPPMPDRMLEYKGRLVRKYPHLEIIQIVIFLKEIDSELVRETQYIDRWTVHNYQVIRLWEQAPEVFLGDANLLALATLAKSDQPDLLLQQISEAIATIPSQGQRNNITACCWLLAGLRFSESLMRSFLREDIMKESVTYQAIIREGIERGIQQGIQQVHQSEINLLRRLINRRFLSSIDPQLEAQIALLSFSQLEDLGEALLDFSSINDLANWLAAQNN